MNKWNINEQFGLELIHKSIMELFNINIIDVLPIQYVCMNLNFYAKSNEILIYNVNIRRNLNSYIKKNYGGFYKLINEKLSDKFKIDTNHLVLL